MKRNWDTIRKILIKVEELEPNVLLTLDRFPKNEHHEISYHLELLEESGLLRGKIHKTPGGSVYDFHLITLTWAGHDFLEAIREDRIWKEIKEKINDQKIGLSIDTILEMAKIITTNKSP